MNHWTPQEISQWAENLATQPKGYGWVSQRIVREILLEAANQAEHERGFSRDDVRDITAQINEIQA
ncbi:MAG: hypothetical protein Q8O16_02300 [Dehalococcoidia bacterium]|nr:hypothetical protein [Dehalococcoidia bacterium]